MPIRTVRCLGIRPVRAPKEHHNQHCIWRHHRPLQPRRQPLHGPHRIDRRDQEEGRGYDVELVVDVGHEAEVAAEQTLAVDLIGRLRISIVQVKQPGGGEDEAEKETSQRFKID